MKVGDLVAYKYKLRPVDGTGILLENINKRFCRILWHDGVIRDQLTSELEVINESW